MSVILALDTATAACSVALQTEEGRILERLDPAGSRHAELVPVFTAALLQEAGVQPSDVHAVVFNAGPGSYTGLRIGLSFLKGFCFGRPVQATAVGTLAALALGALERNPSARGIHAVLDARRQHVYHQVFWVQQGRLIAGSTPEVLEIQTVAGMLQDGEVLAGTGLGRFAPFAVAGKLDTAETPLTAALQFRAAQAFAGTPGATPVDLKTFEPDYLGAPV